MKPLQRFLRPARAAIADFIKRAARGGNRPKLKTGSIRTAIPSRGSGKPSAMKAGSKTVLHNSRAVRLAAVSVAAVTVIAVVLTVMLSGSNAQATAADSAASAEETIVRSAGQEIGAAGAEEAASAHEEPSTSPLSTPDPTPIATTVPEVAELIPGCHDSRIIEVQEKLMELGYLGNDEPTDYYGYGTQYALQLFQRKHSLQVDGLLGEKTLTALFSKDAMPYTVTYGDRGTDVKSIQERLKELRYFTGEATGEFGDRTKTAVENFQRRNGLSPDGIVGENTREALYSENARPASGNGGGGSSGGSSGSHGGGTTIATWEPDSAKVEALIAVAQSLLGHQYVTGSKGPDVFDCSGLVYYCLNKCGYSIGYMTSGGWANCRLPKVTSMADMRRGDIICFKGHVGIYLGNGQMIDASSTSGEVRICTNVLTSSYWKRNFICARRVF